MGETDRAAHFRALAERLTEEVFFPAAAAVDQADRIPPELLDLLADNGFYGVAAPAEAGGIGVADFATAAHLVETFASGALALAFVWIQHHGPVIATAFHERPDVAERWLAPLAAGERRGGIALAGVRPGPAQIRVTQVDGGYRLTGEVPWVTGWDMIDTLHLAALDDAGIVHFLLLDAVAGPTLGATVLDLVAARASRTATLRFNDHVVPADRLLSTKPYDEWVASEAAGSALNGFLALGVVNRCCRLLGPSPFDDELARCRQALLTADSASTPAARAAASELALRASAALAVHTGSRSILLDQHPQRLVREAAFLLVFGTRPAIRDALLARLTPSG